MICRGDIVKKGNKFEDFYFDKENKVLPLQIVVDHANTRDKSFTHYRDHMYCGECRKAKLNLSQRNSGQSSYLYAYDDDSHDANCTLKREPASKKVTKKHFEILKASNQIDSFLHSILVEEIKKYIDSNAKVEFSTSSPTPKSNPYIIKSKTLSRTKAKRLPRKLLNNEFNQQRDSDIIYAFYGKVKLEVKTGVSKAGSTFHRLFIKVKRSNVWVDRAYIFREEGLDVVDIDKEYFLVVAGSLDPKYKGKINLVNDDQSAIKYIEAK